MKKLNITICAAALLVIGGCATPGDPNARAKTGAVVGAVIGGVAGKQVGGDKGAVIGAILGGGSGALIGRGLDQQEADLQARLAAEENQRRVEIARADDQTVLLTLLDEGVKFDTGAATIKAGTSRNTLNKIAASLADFPSSSIRIVGHTDATGSEEVNRVLSERRAQAVADFLIVRGVSPTRITTFGAGELQPVTTNVTEEGRSANRRVEIFITS